MLLRFGAHLGSCLRSVTGQGVESTKNDPAAGALVPSSPEQRNREVGLIAKEHFLHVSSHDAA